MMGQNSFILYTDQKAVIDKLTDEQAGKLIKAIYEYADTGTMPLLDTTLDLVMTPFKIALDKNQKQYEEKCERRSAAGKKGMASRWQKITKDNKDIKCYKEITKITDNDNESDNESDNENDITANAVIKSDGCADGSLQSDGCADEIVKFFNENIGAMTPHEFVVLDSYRLDFADDVILYALQLQVEARAIGINYVKAILNNWKKNNVKNLKDAQAFNAKKQNIKNLEKKDIGYHCNDSQYTDLSQFYMN